jgi:hypothetical protein
MPIFREYCLDFLIARDLAATYSCESLVDCGEFGRSRNVNAALARLNLKREPGEFFLIFRSASHSVPTKPVPRSPEYRLAR